MSVTKGSTNLGGTSCILLDYYAQTRGADREHQFPIHRKLRLSAVIKRNRSDTLLVRWINSTFPDATYIMGNWFAPHARYHWQGFQKAAQEEWYERIAHIDEYLKSQVSSQCHERTLETFLRRENPRSYGNAINHIVTVHG